MIKQFLIYVFLFSYLGLIAQQQVSYNQYNFVPTAYNPAFVGSNDGVDVGVLRNQKWQNYGEGFIANNLNVSAKLFKNHGIGVNLYSDFAGITSKLRAQLQYAYRIKLGAKTYLGIGIGAGIVDSRIDFSSAVVTNVNDPLIMNANQERETVFDLTAGLQLTAGGFRFGMSAPQILGSQLVYGESKSPSYTLEREFVSTIGYSWLVSKSIDMIINPEVLLLYTPGSRFNYNASLIFEMPKYGWIGATYKANYAVGAMVGLNLIKNLKVGFAYDFQTGSLASFNSAPNIEILLKYNFKGVNEPDYSAFEETIDSLNNAIDLNNQEAKKQIDVLKRTNKVLEDSILKWPKSKKSKLELIEKNVRTNSDDHFIELNGSDSENGYYVISGAFAEKSNADAMIRKVKPNFPSARVIKNKRNNLYYVMLYYANEKDEGLAYQSYKANVGLVEETWILYYNRSK